MSVESEITYCEFVLRQETVATWFPKYELPLLSERVKCLRELGHVLNQGASERFLSHVSFVSLLDTGHSISNHLSR
jgi:hypothetical protein